MGEKKMAPGKLFLITWIYNYGDLNYGSPTISLSSIKISGSGGKERS
jgi:hypothetical protein